MKLKKGMDPKLIQWFTFMRVCRTRELSLNTICEMEQYIKVRPKDQREAISEKLTRIILSSETEEEMLRKAKATFGEQETTEAVSYE